MVLVMFGCWEFERKLIGALEIQITFMHFGKKIVIIGSLKKSELLELLKKGILVSLNFYCEIGLAMWTEK